MSQEKVNRYKEQKANRKEIMRKEKRNNKLMKIGAGIIGVIVLCWVGISVPQMVENLQVRESYAIDYSAIDTYFGTIQ